MGEIARHDPAASTWTEEAVPAYVRSRLRMRERLTDRLDRWSKARTAVARSRAGRWMQRYVIAKPPQSRIRKATLRMVVGLSVKAMMAGDRRALDCYYTPDAEIVVPPWPGLGEQYVGAEGFMDFFEGWIENWDELELEMVEVIDTGETVLVIGRMHTRGASSGVRTTEPFSCLQHYRDGKCSRGEWFLSWEEGMTAAGLEGEPLPT
jgi:ketosteroid isomerase-like protein